MPTIRPLNLSDADPGTAATLNAVKAKLGGVPNLLATLANAPAALHGYLQLSETLGTGRLTARQREIVALATAQENACQYCLSVHTLLGKGAGLSEAEIKQARAGAGGNATDAAIAAFVQRVVRQRGQVDATAVEKARAGGLDDGLILEIIANIALSVLTNYTNHVAATEIDFPKVDLG